MFGSQVNKFILGVNQPSGFDFYTSDVNGDNSISVSDVYSIFARVSGRFTSWVNSVSDVLFFSQTEYNTINGSTSNLRSTIPGQTNFTKLIAIFEPVLRSSVTVELPHNRISHKPHDLQNNVGQSP